MEVEFDLACALRVELLLPSNAVHFLFARVAITSSNLVPGGTVKAVCWMVWFSRVEFGDD